MNCDHPLATLVELGQSQLSNKHVPDTTIWCRSCGSVRINDNWHSPERSATSLQTMAIAPVPMLLTCPWCGHRHIDVGEFAHKPHHTHACQNCGMCWRPSIIPTIGVQFLPGFKNGAT